MYHYYNNLVLTSVELAFSGNTAKVTVGGYWCGNDEHSDSPSSTCRLHQHFTANTIAAGYTESESGYIVRLPASGSNSSASITLTEDGSDTLTVSAVSGESYKVTLTYDSGSSAFDILASSTPNAIAEGMEFTRQN